MVTIKDQFYRKKPKDLPRRIYRNLAEALTGAAGDADERRRLIEQFLTTLQEKHREDEFLRMKLVVPRELEQTLEPQELEHVGSVLARLRSKRSGKLFPIHPVCADEFSVDPAFLSTVFDDTPLNHIAPSDQILTMGSCFAINVQQYLLVRGYKAAGFVRSEEINSVFSNALMLETACLPDEDRRSYLGDCYQRILGPVPVDGHVAKEIEQLAGLSAKIQNANFMVLTLGNTIDAFLPEPMNEVAARMACPTLFPRFLRIFQSENIKHQVKALRNVKSNGGSLRLGAFDQVKKAISTIFDSIFRLNPDLKLLVTVSPVPVANTMGVSNPLSLGPIEMDCQSKSTLRAALGEALIDSPDDRVQYFPSFEIVRWMGVNLPMRNFGAQDAGSGHVSDEVLGAVFDFFQSRFCVQKGFVRPLAATGGVRPEAASRVE